MAEQIAQWFSGVPKEWVVLIISMLPIVELRGAIPWALSPAMGPPLHWTTAFALSFFGNLLPIVPILACLGPVSRRLRARSRLCERFFSWLFARTRRKGRTVERYGPIGLALFVAIPLPVTGAWTGAAVAFVFGVPFGKALGYIALGVAVAGTVVTLASLGIFHLFGL